MLQAICAGEELVRLWFSATKVHGRPEKGVHQFTYKYIYDKFSSTMYAVGQIWKTGVHLYKEILQDCQFQVLGLFAYDIS